MTTSYEHLTNDEKNAIAQGTIRSLEYQMYQLEMELVAENARTNPDSVRIQILEDAIAEKQSQIAAVPTV